MVPKVIAEGEWSFPLEAYAWPVISAALKKPWPAFAVILDIRMYRHAAWLEPNVLRPTVADFAKAWGWQEGKALAIIVATDKELDRLERMRAADEIAKEMVARMTPQQRRMRA